ncbi:hypothetical protein VTN00DRAFT_4198 [Thermoascus crustaceus]|uniref:uncharacterized protein n=1 Tax=Thermoascus crustaceus TaxID=5088 RepID=UPI0037424F25
MQDAPLSMTPRNTNRIYRGHNLKRTVRILPGKQKTTPVTCLVCTHARMLHFHEDGNNVKPGWPTQFPFRNTEKD